MKFRIRFLSVLLTFALVMDLRVYGQGGDLGPPRRPQVIEGGKLRIFPIASPQDFSAPTVAGMLQDDRGFIWMASQYGLYRFDGYKFKVFVNNPNDSTSLAGVYIYSLFKDRAGAIWVGCDHSLDQFDPSTESFRHHALLNLSHDEQNAPIMDISQDRSGIMWLSTRMGLYRFDPMTGAQKQYGHDPLNSESLSSSYVKASLEDRDGNFWVATAEGIDKFDRFTGEVTLHLALHEDHEVFLHQDRFGVFWVTHPSGLGLSILNTNTKTLIPIALQQGTTPLKGLSGMRPVLEDNEGTIWIGTPHQGLLKYDREHRNFRRYGLESDVPNNHADNSVSSLMDDRDGNIWATLPGWGPSVLGTKKLQFQPLPSVSDSHLGERYSLIDSLFTDKQGDLWVGTDISLQRYTHSAGQLSPRSIKSLSSLTHVIAIAQDHSGNIWFGTWHNGLTRFDPQTGRTTTYTHNSDKSTSLSNDSVMGLLVDRKGDLWVSNWDALDRFDSVSDGFIKYHPQQGGAPPAFWKLAEDSHGALWIGTAYSGVYRFDPSSGAFVQYRHTQDEGKSLSNDRVNSVFIDHSDNVWLATQNGLNMLDPVSGRITTYYERDGIAGNAVSCILNEKDGTLWMGTNKGISRFNPQTRSFMSYTSADGLPGNDMAGWSTCSSGRDNTFAFGGFSGGVTFRPDDVKEVPTSPSVVLTDLTLEGREPPIGPTSPLDRSITQLDTLIIPSDLKNFSLEFSALNYLNPLETKYRYKLEGLDSDWYEVGSAQRVVTYTSLPVGTFHFRVQAALRRGSWSHTGVDLRIVILPPWWKTWWCRLFLFGVVVLLIMLIYWYRLHQLDSQYRIRFDERVGERIRIARELHDTLLQGFQGLMLRFHVATQSIPEKESSRQVLEDALNRADALLNESRARIRGLRPESIAEMPLSEALIFAAEELRLERPLRFKIILTNASRVLRPAIKDEVYLIGREALTNSFIHSQGSHIDIELKHDQKQFSLRIRDDGKGIPTEVLSAGRRTGHWGICGMRERAAIIGGLLKVSSSSESGTEVELTLPAQVAFAGSNGMALLNDLRALLFERARAD